MRAHAGTAVCAVMRRQPRTCMQLHMHIHTCMHVHVSTRMCAQACMRVCVYSCVCVHRHGRPHRRTGRRKRMPMPRSTESASSPSRRGVEHMHASTHACIHTYMHGYTHTHTHVLRRVRVLSIEEEGDVHTYMHAHTHTSKHTYIDTHTHTYTPTYVYIYIHTYIHAYIHTCIHTYLHTHLHACLHTHTRAPPISSLALSLPTLPTYILQIQMHGLTCI